MTKTDTNPVVTMISETTCWMASEGRIGGTVFFQRLRAVGQQAPVQHFADLNA